MTGTSRTGRRALAVGALSATFVVGAVVAATVAAASPHTSRVGTGRSYTYTLGSTGVNDANGYSLFYASSVNHGGMEYRGDLQDTSRDGNAVYVEAKVEGYSWGGRIYNAKDASTAKHFDQVSYDPSALYVNSGKVHACRDRGTLGADNCRETALMTR